MKAVDAKFEAQKIAFAPMFFQALVAMRDLGLLQYIYKRKGKATMEELYHESGLTKYAVDSMVEAAEVMDVVELDEDRVKVTKIGFYLLRDEMTRVNINFVNDVCYDGAKFMTPALKDTRPAGLKVFGDWSTVYEGLSELPADIRKSWLEFDHFYSQNAFNAALEIVFSEHPKKLFDIGGNTGKWAFKCCEYNSEVEVTILDLPGQLEMAKKNAKERGFLNRINFHQINVLDTSQLIPKGPDAIWMSQFLDCFSEDEILGILKNCAQAAGPDTYIYIMEPFIDNQTYKAAEFSLVGTSLYFTIIANGNSKMYKIQTMRDLVEKAGLKIVEEFPLIADSYHTIQKCKLA